MSDTIEEYRICLYDDIANLVEYLPDLEYIRAKQWLEAPSDIDARLTVTTDLSGLSYQLVWSRIRERGYSSDIAQIYTFVGSSNTRTYIGQYDATRYTDPDAEDDVSLTIQSVTGAFGTYTRQEFLDAYSERKRGKK